MPTPEFQVRYAGLDPRARTFLDMLEVQGGAPIYTLPPRDARTVLTSLQSGDVARLRADFEDRIIPGGPNGQVSIRIVRPPDTQGPLPAVVYCHGGGWVLGDKQTHDRLVRELAFGSQAAIVFVNFTPAPEARYPAQLEEAYAVLKWVAEQGEAAHLDGDRVAVAGDSAGGNLAAALTLMARERGGPRIAQQVLFYPVMDANFDTPSYRQYAEGYFLSRKSMQWFWDCYAPDEATRSLPTASPLRAPLDMLRGLPPALIIVGECDVLRDEGEAYAHQLIDAGVSVMSARYLGIIHDFVMLDALSSTPAARGAVMQACVTLASVLGARRPEALSAMPPPGRDRTVGEGAPRH